MDPIIQAIHKYLNDQQTMTQTLQVINQYLNDHGIKTTIVNDYIHIQTNDIRIHNLPHSTLLYIHITNYIRKETKATSPSQTANSSSPTVSPYSPRSYLDWQTITITIDLNDPESLPQLLQTIHLWTQ